MTRYRVYLALIVFASLAIPAGAQPARHNQGALDAVGEEVTLHVAGMAEVAVEVQGTFVATLGFQIRNRGTWTSVACSTPIPSIGVDGTTATGFWHCSLGGAEHFRVYVAAYTSGTAQVSLAASAVARAHPTPVVTSAQQSGTWSTETLITNTPTVTVGNLGRNILLGQSTAYSVQTAAFAPAATPTDLCIIGGHASSTIKVIDVRLTGTATAATTVDVFLVRRSTANSAGTFVAGTIVGYDLDDDSVDPTVGHYTANPTINSTVGTLLASKVLLPIATTVATSNANQNLLPPGSVVQLDGTAEQLAINFAGAALPAGAANFRCHFSWIEE